MNEVKELSLIEAVKQLNLSRVAYVQDFHNLQLMRAKLLDGIQVAQEKIKQEYITEREMTAMHISETVSRYCRMWPTFQNALSFIELIDCVLIDVFKVETPACNEVNYPNYEYNFAVENYTNVSEIMEHLKIINDSLCNKIKIEILTSSQIWEVQDGLISSDIDTTQLMNIGYLIPDDYDVKVKIND